MYKPTGDALRITHLLENLDRGGLERVVIDLVTAQLACGDACQVVCLYDPGLLADEMRSAGAQVTACHKTAGFDWRAVAAIRQILRQHADTVLHTHNAMANYYGVAAALGLGLKRIVNTRHGAGTGLSKRADLLYRASLLSTDAVATVSEHARQLYASRGLVPRKISVAVPNGIPLTKYAERTTARRDALLAELGLPAHSVVIGIVGRLHPLKDHRTLLLAMKQLLAEGAGEAVLVVVGGGSSLDELRSFGEELGLAERVRWLGDRSDVPELLRAFDIFTLSSTSEGYSIALVEAAASALPTAATDVGGNPEIVAHERTGLIVPSRDPARLAVALGELVADPTKRKRMGEAALKWAHDHGSIQAMAERYAQLYEGGVGAS